MPSPSVIVLTYPYYHYYPYYHFESAKESPIRRPIAKVGPML